MLTINLPPPILFHSFLFFPHLFHHFSKKNLKISGGGLNPLDAPPPLNTPLSRKLDLLQTSSATRSHYCSEKTTCTSSVHLVAFKLCIGPFKKQLYLASGESQGPRATIEMLFFLIQG